ncbi:hypothetical protein GQ54DRAFT_327469 [Martensiomyces pterosporus]|nr:hypothetical protein GQ54DRAFT_327469 [Martensiomyces pterosporus]
MSAASSQPPGFDQRPANAFASNHTGFLSGLLAPATSSAAPSAKAPVPPVPSAGPFSSFVPLASKSAAAASTAPAQKPIFGSLASMPPLPAEAPELKDGLTKETHVPSLTTSLAGHPHTPLPGSNSSQPVAANIVWNKPRQRISWTSLCDTLFDDLVASLAREVAQPVSAKAKRNKEIADTLTADIADAIVDYTGAFVAYEEAYRSVLFAKADHFQRRAALNSAFARWAMELTVRQQESALHQQHIDDLEEIVDREYTLQEPVSLGTCDPFSTPRKARHQQQAIISPASYRQNYANRTAKHSGFSNVSPISPDAFWESCHIGHDGFEAICRSLGRFGDPPFRLAVDIAGTGNDSVLSSWLWWQIDPDSIARSSSSGGPSRSVEYGKGAQHLVIQEAGDLSSAGVAGEHRGKVILLSPHPVSDDDVRTGLEDSATGTEIAASAGSIASALRSDGATSDECALLLFWCSSSKSGKAGRKFVEKSIRDGCISASLAHLKIVALDIESPKKQLVAGFKWVYSRMSCARQALLVRASKALGPVSASMLQSLRRMHGCVVGLLGQQYSEPNSVLIFNKTVDIANAFVDVLRTHLFGSTSSISVHWYPHMQGTALDRDFFIQCISSTTVDKEGGTRPLLLEADALLCASIDEILASGRPADNQQPTLDAYLRALEFMARHQLDVLQQTTPGDMYAERPAIGAAAEKAIQHSDQLISECSRVSQSEGYTTPAFATPGNKRTSSLAFNSTSSTPTAATSCLATSPTTARSSITAIKRRKPGPSSKLSKLQSAIARASKQLE